MNVKEKNFPKQGVSLFLDQQNFPFLTNTKPMSTLHEILFNTLHPAVTYF